MDIDKLARAWRKSSLDDFKVAKSLFEKKHYGYCLFFCHLAVEKELKRIYLLKRKEMPPQIHNLVRILEKAGIVLDDTVRQDLQELTTFNIKARYEITKSAFHQRAKKSYTRQWLNRTEQLIDLLRKLK
jgi:HEPN domain-containing protein